MLLLGLHSAIVEGVHPRIGATVDATIRRVQPLRLVGDSVGDVVALQDRYAVQVLRHCYVAASVEA